MTTVLRAHGFRVAIYPPPREHGPPLVHVFHAEGVSIVLLPRDSEIHHGEPPRHDR